MSAPAPVLSTVRDAAGLVAAAPGWDELVLAMARPSPFLLHAWLSAWWRHHGGRRALQVQLAHRGDRLVGALPLFAERRGGARVARFVGGADAALVDVLIVPGEESAVAGALVARAAAEPNDVADLASLPANSRLAAVLGPDRLALVPRADAPVLDLAYQGYDTERFATQRAGIRLAEANPVGIGPGQLDVREPISSHSTYVRVLAEQGTLGFVVLVALLLATLAVAADNAASDRSTWGIGSAALLAAWCGLLANSFFIDSLH